MTKPAFFLLFLFSRFVLAQHAFFNSEPKQFQIESPEETKINVQSGGDIQFDTRYTLNNDSKVTGYLGLKQIRPSISVKYGKMADARALFNVANGKVETQDVWITLKLAEGFQLRTGKFKVPFGLEYLQSPTVGVLMENSLSSNLVPKRDVGVMLLMNFFGKKLQAFAGLFNGAIDGASEDSDNGDQKDIALRAFFMPFSEVEGSFLRKLGFGGAFTTGVQEGSVSASRLPSYRTQASQSFFSYSSGVLAKGNNSRFAGQLSYYNSQFGLLAEFISSTHSVVKGTLSEKFTNTSWQATVSYLLTEDEASFEGVKPKNPMSDNSQGIGAFEIAARIGQLKIDEAVFSGFAVPNSNAQKVSSAALGITWYLNDYYKLQINYEVTGLEYLVSTSAMKTERLLMARTQVVF